MSHLTLKIGIIGYDIWRSTFKQVGYIGHKGLWSVQFGDSGRTLGLWIKGEIGRRLIESKIETKADLRL